ncbi:MAG TPA: hypothetical protein PKM25_07145 [Candidatus Ozemobacteraceae bacterium]|nr:hypothetical protein [Candidatus Ozemobacteraceae bacterium]
MVEFDDLVSPPPPHARKTARMMAVAAGSWENGSIGAAPPPPPGATLNDVRRPVSSISGGDLAAIGLPSAGPGRLKVDLTTTLEKLFLWAMIVTGIIAGIALISVFTEKEALPVFIGAFAPFIVSSGLYWLTDNYYVVDVRNRMFLYHFHFGIIDFDWSVAPFSRIAAFTTTSVHNSSKKGKHGPRTHWWEYATVAVLDTGKIIPVTDFRREALSSGNYMAEKLSKLMQSRYVSGRSKCVPVVKRDSMGRITITQEEPSDVLLVLVILGLVIVAAAASVLGGK